MTSSRSALSLLAAAAALGLGACGGDTEGGIPPSDADTLREELSEVERFVERGDCDEVDGQVRQVRNAVAELPNSVDPELRDNLSEGVGVLESVVATDCQEQADEADDELQEEVTTTETTEPPEEEEPEPEPEPETEPPPETENENETKPKKPKPDDGPPSDELPPAEEGIPLDEVGP